MQLRVVVDEAFTNDSLATHFLYRATQSERDFGSWQDRRSTFVLLSVLQKSERNRVPVNNRRIIIQTISIEKALPQAKEAFGRSFGRWQVAIEYASENWYLEWKRRDSNGNLPVELLAVFTATMFHNVFHNADRFSEADPHETATSIGRQVSERRRTGMDIVRTLLWVFEQQLFHSLFELIE